LTELSPEPGTGFFLEGNSGFTLQDSAGARYFSCSACAPGKVQHDLRKGAIYHGLIYGQVLMCLHRGILSPSCTPGLQGPGVGGRRQNQGSFFFHTNPPHNREAVPCHGLKWALFPEEL